MTKPKAGVSARSSAKKVSKPAPSSKSSTKVTVRKKQSDWKRPTAAEVKRLRDQLATAELQLGEWRKSAKQARQDHVTASQQYRQTLNKLNTYKDTHTVHNAVALALVVVLVVAWVAK